MAQTADILITNARAITLDPAQPAAEAVAVCGNKLAFVGSTADAIHWRGTQTRVIDAQQCTLLPGLIDSHFHLQMGSLKLNDIQLDGISEYARLTQTIRAFGEMHPERFWLVGYGLGYNTGPEGQALTRQALDAIVADRPLIVFAFDLHTAWANTRALELANLLQGATCEPGNEVVMAADQLASGELRESGAYNPVRALFPKLDQHQKRALLRQGLAQAARLGITSVHNMDGDLAQLTLYADLEAAGELTLRIYCPFSVTPATPVAALSEAVAMRDAFASDLVRSACVKFFMDGVVESSTAFLLDEYVNQPGWRGEPLFSAEHFAEMATAADQLGLQIFVHAIGDAAVRRTLDGFARAQQVNGRRDSRHRIEHVELLHPDDLPRFQALGVIASMQPLHAAVSSPTQLWSHQVGTERWLRGFPWQSLRASGATLVFGSDWPVVTQNPWQSLHAALTRQPWAPAQPIQAQTLSDALAAYTRDGAYAEFQEGKKGQLCVGQAADLVLLSSDLAAAPVETLKEMTVALTICDGRVVYER